MNTKITFRVESRKITPDRSIILIGDNADYTAAFSFDEDMQSGRVKNARFIKDGKKEDRILDDDDTCKIPSELLKKGFLQVGIYTDDKATTPCYLQIIGSIKELELPDEEADPDIYRQLLERIEKLKGLREIELQSVGREIQWRYVGDAEWQALLTVERGETGKQGPKGDTGNVYFASFAVKGKRLKMYSDPALDKVKFQRKKSRLFYRLYM